MLMGIGYSAGIFSMAVLWGLVLLQDKSVSNPQAKPQLCQVGENMLRAHADLESIHPRPNPAPEFARVEPVQVKRE